MSFSSNPLGQGARLDHNSFMNNNQPRLQPSPEHQVSPSPSRRGVIPLSYAYGYAFYSTILTRDSTHGRWEVRLH